VKFILLRLIVIITIGEKLGGITKTKIHVLSTTPIFYFFIPPSVSPTVIIIMYHQVPTPESLKSFYCSIIGVFFLSIDTDRRRTGFDGMPSPQILLTRPTLRESAENGIPPKPVQSPAGLNNKNRRKIILVYFIDFKLVGRRP
jgi:hypothetical protein